MDACDFKDEVLRMLLRPLEEIAHQFAGSFAASNFWCKITHFDWKERAFVIRFDALHQPTSDALREAIQNVYKTHWDGKRPEGLQCVYKGVKEHGAYASTDFAIEVYVTISRHLFGLSVFSEKEAIDHERQNEYLYRYRGDTFTEFANRPVFFVQRPRLEQMNRERREVDPGEQVPVLRSGLFQI